MSNAMHELEFQDRETSPTPSLSLSEKTQVLGNADVRYLDLLKRCLTASIYPESGWMIVPTTGPFAARGLGGIIARLMKKKGRHVVIPRPFSVEVREKGGDWPMFGYSMMGLQRMNNLQACVESVLRDGIPGDVLEAGVWRGGGCILMKAILEIFSDSTRNVWVADSFQGLPVAAHAVDVEQGKNHDLSDFEYLSVSAEEVKENFRRFGVLDERVRFLPGWFHETLPSAPIDRLALLRLDGDMYESTRDILSALYARLSPGAYVIVDDYHSWTGCKTAIDEFRSQHSIVAPMIEIDGAGVWWRT